MSVFGVFLVRSFPHLYWIRRFTEQIPIFSPNVGKHEPEKFRIGALFMQCYLGHTKWQKRKYLWSCYCCWVMKEIRKNSIMSALLDHYNFLPFLFLMTQMQRYLEKTLYLIIGMTSIFIQNDFFGSLYLLRIIKVCLFPSIC